MQFFLKGHENVETQQLILESILGRYLQVGLVIATVLLFLNALKHQNFNIYLCKITLFKFLFHSILYYLF